MPPVQPDNNIGSHPLNLSKENAYWYYESLRMHALATEMISDETLMEQTRRGSPSALAEMVERHHAPLVGYLYMVTGGQRPLAEDLAQEVFLRIIQSAASYQTGRPFKPWLYAIATNLARDHFRRLETRQTEAWSENLEMRRAQPEHDPESALLRSEQGKNISTALFQLSDTLRTTLVLRFYQDLSLQDIAQILDIPVGTVKSRLSIAIHRLRAQFTGESAEDVREEMP